MNLKSQLLYVWAKIKDKSALYYIIGHIKHKIYGKEIYNVLKRAKECPICFERCYCIECGCETIPLFLSGKKCKKWNGRTKK